MVCNMVCNMVVEWGYNGGSDDILVIIDIKGSLEYEMGRWDELLWYNGHMKQQPILSYRCF